MKTVTVSELTHKIKIQLETQLGVVSVRGEISNLKHQASGHLYFTLKDAEAQISAVLFKTSSKGLVRLPKEGDQIIASGSITVYPPRGNYQLLVRDIQYQGTGELLIRFQELKAKLQAKGLFSEERKKKLPKFPKTVGVITSPTGAVIQDIIHVLQRRHAGFQLVLSPVKVQGDGAAKEIALAIDQMNQYKLVDVLIVGRGGGSLEDLWAFNEEVVVEAIAQSKIPIISAVGHETDFTLCDCASDVRAPTPSAAAEIVMAEKEQHYKFLFQTKQRMQQHCKSLYLRQKQRLQSTLKHPYLASPHLLFAQRSQELDDYKSELLFSISNFLQKRKLQLVSYEKQKSALQPMHQVQSWRQKFLQMDRAIRQAQIHFFQTKQKFIDPVIWHKKIDFAINQKLTYKKEKLRNLILHLTAIDPKNLLTKGYCILFSENLSSVILSSKDLALEKRIQILMKDGQIKAKVEEIQHV